MSDPPSSDRDLEWVARIVLKVPPDQEVEGMSEGGLWLAWEAAAFRLLVQDCHPRLLVAQAVAVENLAYTPQLLEEINRINAGIVSARVFYDDGWVVVQDEIPLQEATERSLSHFVWAVGSLAAWLSEELHEQFGGDMFSNPAATPLPSSSPSS